MFTFNSEVPHFAVVILNKVDVVFGNEARNAFNRFNKEKFYNQPLEVVNLNLDPENKLLLIGNFVNAQGAIEYLQKTKPVAGKEIIPWLKADKYSFTIVSQQNLDLLKSNLKLEEYRKFIEQHLPGKF